MSYTAHLRSNPAKKIWKAEHSDYLCGTDAEINDLAKASCMVRGGLRSDFSAKEINEISRRFADVVIVADTSLMPALATVGFVVVVLLSIFL